MTYMMDKVIHKKCMSWFARVTQRCCTDHPPRKTLTVHSLYKFIWRFVLTIIDYLPMNSPNHYPAHFPSFLPLPYWGVIIELIQINYHFLKIEEKNELPKTSYGVTQNQV